MIGTDGVGWVCRGEAGYPVRLLRLGEEAPEALEVQGEVDLLAGPVIGLFCSVCAPGRVIVFSYDLAMALAERSVVVAGGFHSPVEREVLEYLLRGSGRVVLCPARSLQGMRLPRAWEEALEAGRMLLVSPFPPALQRAEARTVQRRNRIVAALCSRLLVLHASPGGRVARVVREAAGWGIPLECVEHPLNEDLRMLGATPTTFLPRSGGQVLEGGGGITSCP